MKIPHLPLPLLGLWLFASPQVRAEFNPSEVSAGARWVVYADFNTLRQSVVGKELIALVQRQGGRGLALPVAGTSVTLDLPRVLATLGSVTAYGANFTKDPNLLDGTLIAAGTPELRKILEAVLLECEEGKTPQVADVTGLGYSAYAVNAPGSLKPGHGVVVAFPPEGLVIVAQSEDQIRRARDLARGVGDSLAQAAGSELGELAPNAAHAMVFAASVMPPAGTFSGNGPHTRLLQMTHAGSIAIGEDGAKTFAHVQLVAADDDSADKLVKILQGMAAMMSLAQSSDQQLTDFLNSAQAARDGDRVSFQLAYDSNRLAAMIRQMTAEPTHAKSLTVAGDLQRLRSEQLERTLGKRVAVWSVPAAAAGAEEKPAPIWHELPNVTLTNGAEISVNVAGRGSEGSARLESVEIVPSQGGAPLTFSRRMMSRRAGVPGESGLLQFAFPGEDGTYTLRVRYSPPRGRSASLDLWVKNGSADDSRYSQPTP